MPPTKKPVPDPVERQRIGTPDEIRQRLSAWVEHRFAGNWTRAAREMGISPATLDEWKTGVQRARWPNFENLWRLVEHGLSVDWLITGRGDFQIKRFEAQTEIGVLLALLRPHLQQLAGVGEFTDNQAFDRLVAELGPEGMMRCAAQGLFERYREFTDDVRRVQETSQAWGWLLEHLERLIRAVDAGDAATTRAELQEMSREIEGRIPGNVAFRRAHEEWQRHLVEEARRQGLNEEALLVTASVAKKLQATVGALDAIRESSLRDQQRTIALLTSIENTLKMLESDVDRLTRVQSTTGLESATNIEQ